MIRSKTIQIGLSRNSRGSVAIEFAVVAPLLIFILGAIVETGAFLLTQYQIQNATQDVTRKKLQLGKAPLLVSDFKTEVCAKISLNNCTSAVHVNVQRAATFGALPSTQITSVGPPTFGGSYTDVYQPANPGEAGSVIITYDWRFNFPFLGDTHLLFSNWRAGLGFGNVPGRTDIRRLYGNTVYMAEI